MQNKKPMAKKGVLKRLIKTVFSFYPRLLPFTLCCIVFSAIVSALPPIFMQKIIAEIEAALTGSLGWSDVGSAIIGYTVTLGCIYVVSLTSAFTYNQLMAIITQGSLKKFRDKMFSGMQDLPVK